MTAPSSPIVRALVALCLAAPTYSFAACTVEAIELPVTMVGSRAVITVGINGKDVPLTVDSGAFFSFLTDAVAQQLELPLSHLPFGFSVHGLMGRVDAQKTTVKQLRIINSEIPNVEFVVGGNEPGSGTVGLLGRNVLSLMDAEYDLAHGVIRLLAPSKDCGDSNMAYWAGKTPVSELELEDQRKSKLPAITADVRLNGKTVRALFDTGATSTVSLSAAHRAGVKDADMKLIGESYGLGRGTAKEWTAAIPKLEIGGETIVNNRLFITDFDADEADMLLGIDFFLSHRIYVSKRQQKMYFTYNGGTVFVQNAAALAEASSASGAGDPSNLQEPADAAGFARRGAAYAARGNPERALADLNRACEMAPDDAGNFTMRARVHESMEQWPAARQDLNTALRLDPGQTDARMRRALLNVTNERARAVEDLQVLDTTLPPQSNMRRNMAQMYAHLDLQDRALAEWDQWLKSHPNEIGRDAALNARCWTRMLMGVELDKALADCEDAVDLQPKNASFLDSRAWVRLRRGEFKSAVSDFDRALGIVPTEPWSLYGRGIARTKLGSASEGTADIDAARKLKPSIDEEAGRHGLAMVAPPAAR